MAILAYTAWGFLSPVGKILLDEGEMGPFTINAVRTAAALLPLALLIGIPTSRRALASLTNWEVWVLGGAWLPLTFVPYLWSLQELEPTITTLTVYLSPLLVAAWQRFVWREPVSPLILPTVAFTLAGAALALMDEPNPLEGAKGLAFAAALLGVIGWTCYTIHLKRLGRSFDGDTLTLGAFMASLPVFAIGAFAFEGFHVVWTPRVIGFFALYVLVPSVLSFYWYSRSIQLAPTATISVLLGVELVATALVSIPLTGERFTLAKTAGLVVVLVAVTIYLWDEQRRASKAK